jgi:hypothetical protein
MNWPLTAGQMAQMFKILLTLLVWRRPSILWIGIGDRQICLMASGAVVPGSNVLPAAGVAFCGDGNKNLIAYLPLNIHGSIHDFLAW